MLNVPRPKAPAAMAVQSAVLQTLAAHSPRVSEAAARQTPSKGVTDVVHVDEDDVEDLLDELHPGE
jgi:hypothetical protein